MKKFTIKNLFAVLCLALLAPMNALADVRINATNFPDAKFRAYLLEQDYGRDGVITDEEIAEITGIGVKGMSISTLEGIQYFTALRELDCEYNQLTSLDVTNNTALEELDCGFNQLMSLDVTNNTELRQLDCGFNQLTSLDVSDCTVLDDLECDYNQLTSLDVSGCTALLFLYCRYNQLTSLDVSNNTALTTLYCYSNQLTSLDVSGCTALLFLYCYDNQLTSLDVSNNTTLWNLHCNYNQLTNLDVTNNTELEGLMCNGNQLTSLDVTKNTALTDLYCYYNQIKGANMDTLISSLPNKSGDIYIYDNTSGTEGNVCTKSQVAAIKEKGWTPYYLVEDEEITGWKNWEEYEGSDDLDGIIATEMGNDSEFGANAKAYDLNGNRVVGWQNRKGVYIVGGKKIVVK